MSNPQKIEAVAELKKLLVGAKSFFVTDYQGLNVADMTVLRKTLRHKNVTFLVAKNTLLKRAVHEAGVEGLDEHLLGPTAIAFTAEDPVVTAKILYDYYKDKERPRMKVFVVDGQLHKAGDISRLAELPPKEILYSQLVAAVEAPLSQLVGALNAVFQELVGSIEALAEKRKSEG